jgi:RimJ/RimL family protein N-acetyltransferase
MIIQSQRLYLREATPDDAEVFFRMDSDPEVMRHIGNGLPSIDPEVTRAGLSWVIAAYSMRPGFGLWPCCSDTRRSGCLRWAAGVE